MSSDAGLGGIGVICVITAAGAQVIAIAPPESDNTAQRHLDKHH
jgi:hypothetical protein